MLRVSKALHLFRCSSAPLASISERTHQRLCKSFSTLSRARQRTTRSASQRNSAPGQSAVCVWSPMHAHTSMNAHSRRNFASSAATTDKTDNSTGVDIGIGIVGSGPAAFYTAKYLLKELPNVKVDMCVVYFVCSLCFVFCSLFFRFRCCVSMFQTQTNNHTQVWNVAHALWPSSMGCCARPPRSKGCAEWLCDRGQRCTISIFWQC